MKKIILASYLLASFKLATCGPLDIPEDVKEKYNFNLPTPTPEIKNRTEFIKKFPKNKIVAEIGVQEGFFSEEILKYTQPEHLYLIDCWSQQNPNDYNDSANVNNNEQEKIFQAVKEKFKNNPKVTVIKAFSPEAAELFADNFFDWIYIDANHSYEGAKKDLEGWFNKVKTGGIIAGHDYYAPHPTLGVAPAVNEFIDKRNLKLEYLSNEDNANYGIRK